MKYLILLIIIFIDNHIQKNSSLKQRIKQKQCEPGSCVCPKEEKEIEFFVLNKCEKIERDLNQNQSKIKAQMKLKQSTNKLLQRTSQLQNQCSNAVECSFDTEIELCQVSEDISECGKINLKLMQNAEECRQLTEEKVCIKPKGQIGAEKTILMRQCCDNKECTYDSCENTCSDKK